MVRDRGSDVLTWKCVSAWTRPRNKVKRQTRLLDNVCGLGRSGSLSAIVGPSGAGKTTLLAILNGRFKGVSNAEIRLNGRLTDPSHVAVNSGFVCQKHFVFEEMLVTEHLEFMARMKMDKKASFQTRKKTVLKIVENLSLSHRLHVKISSLSGGQRKRLALAVQLITNPKILFCDEPTTGLDSYIAAHVIKSLRLMADQGKMIICSIHQPTPDIFQMFDSVSLLASGGTLAYHGPVSHISDYFSSFGMECPNNFNLSEYIVTQVTIRPPNIEGSENDSEKVAKIVQRFHHSTEYEILKKSFSQTENESKSNNDFQSKRNNLTRISFFVQLPWLLWRTALLIRLDYKREILKFLIYFMVMACLAFSYGVQQIDQVGMKNIQGLLFFLLTEIAYCCMYGVIFMFSEEIPIFIQEYADRSYSLLAYYSSKMIILSIKAAFDAFIYTTFVFVVTGLNKTLEDYVLLSGPLILVSLVTCAFGCLLSTAFESITTASLFEVPYQEFSTLFGGFHLRLNSLPSYLSWLKYISFPYYTFEALSITLWSRYKSIECDKLDKIDCFHDGDQVLASFGFNKENIYLDYCGLTVLVLIFHVLGFLFLLKRINITSPY